MSSNIPVVSDTAWAVGGRFKQDFGGPSVSHFCVMLTGGKCTDPYNTDFNGCKARCFGHGFSRPAVKHEASKRSVVDQYPGMGRWSDDGQVDLWVYPKNCKELKEYQGTDCTYSGSRGKNPSFNPQGYAFTLAGNGESGFSDGPAANARFNFPEDVAIDEAGNVFVADTKNNAIRMVTLAGLVKTVAGKGPNTPGYKDGPCTEATFANPKGLDVRTEVLNGASISVIIVADTGNHRIRRIEYNLASGACTVRCLTGLCGNNSLSAADFSFKATPLTGYADGNGNEARFSAPESVAFMEGNYFVVADTGNYLLRWVIANNGTTYTLAGTIIPGERDANGKPLPGCTPPCMAGQQGFRDGNLSFAQFYNPLDVTRGPNNTLWVTDEQRVRVVELPHTVSTMYGIRSSSRVSTIAGTAFQGYDDGLAQLSNFFYPSGLFVNNDGVAYVIDAMKCRLRRVTPYPLVAEGLTCTSTIYQYIRPSGCVSFDTPIDKIGRKISRVEGNIQYNYGWPNEKNDDRGKYIKNCVGVPPRDKLDKRFVLNTGDNLVIDDYRTEINEDSEQGMAILVRCPPQCASSFSGSTKVEGNVWYSERSSVCIAALHDGKITAAKGGIILVILERRDFMKQINGTYFGASFEKAALRNGIQSADMPDDIPRVFKFEQYNVSNNMVHSIGGQPAAPLEEVCGFQDGQPATLAVFNNPSGVTARYGRKLSDDEYLYVADTNNHRIRAVSAVCSFICENGGRCVADDKCACKPGWTGIDCTTPVCSSPCGPNSLCVAPDTCGCKPGYSGSNCNIPLCQQRCLNGGVCSAPDTCSCAPGWFDTNCTTPVCSQTCANGGNCTAPSTCACPKEWTGHDCRIPVCEQKCLNKGFCIAPNTCACAPQWTNFDCSAPVCSQGYFEAFPGAGLNAYYTVRTTGKPTYKNCDLQSWCNATNEFECDQQQMSYGIIGVPSGPEYRGVTGRKTPPTQCMNIELPIYYKIPFQLVYSDNTTTGNVRYSPFSPYTSHPANPWKGYLSPVGGHTGPWVYDEDRQVANVVWLNVSQGRYVCANGGSCVAPEICACAPGWVGFDCRTPVCEQGYYKSDSSDYVSGEGTDDELDIFLKYLGNNSYRLKWPYSNPNFTAQYEYYTSPDVVVRLVQSYKGKSYLGQVNYSRDGSYAAQLQGGYRCTIRANTEWENEYFVFNHPNFYSQYMDRKVQADGITYTFWENFNWLPTHQKSRIIDQYAFNFSFSFTNEGYRRRGIWNVTGNPWEFGICIIEFNRNCTNPKKDFDLQSELFDVYVQDTDIAYRPRITFNDFRVNSKGRWKQSTGTCIDEVVRGCANNGTCVAPNTCKCSTGWKGPDCRVPICTQTCHHNGNCTSPDICTCEKGWSGFDCQIPLCAQECQNGGRCVAPDTCQCFQYDNTFRDGRIAGGRPLFQDETGDPLSTGWTGFDCSVPICVQAEKFVVNVPSSSSPGFITLGGHGADGLMTCTENGVTLPRCPQFDVYLTGNDGKTWQAGCGWDPYDTGCCIEGPNNAITCYKCNSDIVMTTNHTFFCAGDFTTTTGTKMEKDKFGAFLDSNRNFRMCGEYHSPRDRIDVDVFPPDYGKAKYYVDVLNPEQSNYNFLSNWTSNRFLCNVNQWIQGDYIDDAGLGKISAVGSVYGLQHGRHVRINTANIKVEAATQTFKRGPKIYGEGIYQCYNEGSCLAPDTCTCTDGYEGYDCNTPLCRHLQPSGAVSGCLNGGICTSKDNCVCVQTTSVLWKAHPEGSRGITGWTGTDCSMPMCVQGYFDPFCTDLPQAPGGEGCYRCANSGNCTAPDVCTCAKGWTGYDCKTPVCEIVADPLTRTQLGTVFEDKVIGFETDPCGVQSIYGLGGWKGRKYTRGNCTEPNQCTCLCKIPFDRRACRKSGKFCDGPWQDLLVNVRNLLIQRGPQFTFGSTDCRYGYEGNVNKMDRFVTCHQTIFNPSSTESNSLGLIVAFTLLGFFGFIFYRYASVRLKRKFLLAKIERRKTKRSSEESLLSAGTNSFVAR